MAKKPVEEGGQGGAYGAGTETLEVKSPHDPNALRKAIFMRGKDMQQAEREIATEQTPGAEELQAVYDKIEQELAAGATNEGSAATDDGDTPGESAIQPPRTSQPAAPVVESAATPNDGDGQSVPDPNETVALKVNGRDVFRPRAEVDQNGGVEIFQIKLAAEQATQKANALMRRAEQMSAEAANQQKRFESTVQSGTPTPNTGANAQPHQAQAAQVDPATVDRMVESLWSGEPEKARAAITEVLAGIPRGQAINMGALQDLVTARVNATIADRDAAAAQTNETTAVNDLMRQDRYKPIMDDEDTKATAVREFRAAEADPRNKGRSKVHIASEVAERMLRIKGIDTATPALPAAEVRVEQGARTNFKRRIPVSSNASERANPNQQEQRFPTKPSDVINQLRQARGQPLIPSN